MGRHRMDLPWVLLATCAAVVPLWYYKYPPATDLPHHVAISSVLYRLFQGDPAISHYYALNLQPVPYYLLYAFLTPCVGWFGAFTGMKVLLTGILLACVGATCLCCRALRHPLILGIGGIFLFYSTVFFWGFATTLIGIPCVLFCVWALLRFDATRQARFAWTAGAMGALACAAHAVLILPVGIAVGAFWSMQPRRNMPAAFAIGGLCLLPAIPWALTQLQASGSSGSAVITFETPRTAWNHLRLHLAPFDRGLGRNAHQGLIALLAGLAWLTRGGDTAPQRRFCRLFALGNLALFAFAPVEITSPTTWAWLLNVRYLVFAEAGLLLLCAEPSQRRIGALLRLILPLTTAAFLLALGHMWQAFDAAAQPLGAIARALPPNSTAVVRSPPERFPGAWPPLTSHLYAYLLAEGLAFEAGVFADGHVPIKTRQQPPGLSVPPGGVLLPVGNDESPLRMGDCDYAVVQASQTDSARIPAPLGGRLIFETGRWKVFQSAPPHS